MVKELNEEKVILLSTNKTLVGFIWELFLESF